MELPDVNVLVYARREDAVDHVRYREWLERLINGDEAFGMADLVLSGFLRVVTHPRIFDPPTRLEDALVFVDTLTSRPNCVRLATGPRHWELFAELCRKTGAKGNVVPDAYHAALAIETGSTWVTADRGFARFPGLRWKHPLD